MMRTLRQARWAVAAVCVTFLGACHGEAAIDEMVVKPSTALDEFSVSVDVAASKWPANRLLLGNNVQWVDRGDDLLDAQGVLRPDMLDRVRALHPGILRYPGGSQADTYHWQKGVGPIQQRGDNEHFNARRMQQTIMGTQEFLELCEAVSAQALITVNVASGTPEEAASWVALTNHQGLISRRTGLRLAAVKYWEIGNEPYLKDDAQKKLWLSPEQFGRRVQAFIQAMRRVDPEIQISLPLTNDMRNGFPATAYPGFTRRVLQQVSAPIDYVSLHNAYMPFAMARPHTRQAMYWGAMAASRTVEGDVRSMRSLLHELRPPRTWPIALTEYSAIFTLGRGESDEWIASPVAGLYAADLLRTLATMPDVLIANYWSLSGNWEFGAIRADAGTNPIYPVLVMFSELMKGEIMIPKVQAQQVNTHSVGESAAVEGLPLLESLATREAQTLRVLLIHKDDARPGHGSVRIEGASALTAQLAVLVSDDVWQVGAQAHLTRQEQSLAVGPEIIVDLPPHSVALLTLGLATP